jgi:hypothetical protein
MTSKWQQWIDGVAMSFVESVEDAIINDDNVTTTFDQAIADAYEGMAARVRQAKRKREPGWSLEGRVSLVRPSGLLIPLKARLFIGRSLRPNQQTSEALARQLTEADRPLEILKQYQEGNHGKN